MDDDREKNQNQVPPIKKELWIKLKIPKIEEKEQEHEEEFEEEDEDDDQEEELEKEDQSIGHRIGHQTNNDESRVCPVCNKGFSSGKALGGHMRVHVQSTINNGKNPISLKKYNPKQQQHAYNNEQSSSSSRPMCSLCKKDFPSMKSLFGHMRCHPEREWRGWQPPPNLPHQPPPQPRPMAETSSSVSPSVSTDQIDLTKCLPGWSSTDKRGRRALTTTAAAAPKAEEDRLREAVEYLMSLANGGSSDSGLTIENKNRVGGEIEDDKNWGLESRDYPMKKLKIEEWSGGSPSGDAFGKKNLGKGKGKAVLDIPNWCEDDETESQDSDDDSIPSGEMIVNYKCGSGNSNNKPVTTANKSRKKRKKMKLRDLGNCGGVDDDHQIQIQKPNPVFRCTTCDKCFPSHQALGGHRSSHNKIRNTSHNVEYREDSDIQVTNHHPITGFDLNEEGGGGSKVVVAESSSVTTHQCKICNKIFPTGQALGGHKRCHWMGPVEVGPPSQVESSAGEASQTGRKDLGFDLNELPAMEEEEEGGAWG